MASIAIALSRVLGLIREQVFAAFFGASPVQDAFVAAFRIPNLLRDLFAEGALSQSFVAVFSQKMGTEQKPPYRLANTVLTFILIAVGLMTVLGMVFSPQIVSLIAAGFEGQKFELTVSLNRILFPFILFASLAALFMGMLNSQNRYFLPQSASSFFNLTSIVTGLGLAFFLEPQLMQSLWNAHDSMQSVDLSLTQMGRAITGMAFGTLLGGVVQWLIQYPELKKLGYRILPNLDFKNPDFVRILKLTGPAILGGAAVQINVMINTYFASYLADGSVSWLNFAFRFMQFPLGVFGVAIATASAPKLASLLGQNRAREFRDTLNESIKMSLFLSIPSLLGLFVLAHPIVSLIYEHGHFTAFDTHATALALMSYSLGIASYSLIKIYQPAYLAFGDAKTPMLVSLFSVLSNFAINWYLVRVMGFAHWGLALGVSVVATINLLLLAFLFTKKMRGLWQRDVFLSLGRTLLASFIMAAAVWGALYFCQLLPVTHKILKQLLEALVPIFIGGGTYLLVSVLFKQEEALYFLRKMRREKSK